MGLSEVKKKVSLVLSGGGARGIAHIGVIEELEKQGFEIKSISGTSIGAVVGGVYAMGKMEEYKKWLYTLDYLKLFNLLDFTFSKQGLIKGDKFFEIVNESIPDMNIEDLRINYTATATDITNNREFVFTEGSVYDAVRASVSFPTVFTPVEKGDMVLIDGGIVNNVPISNLRRIKDDILVVVDVNADVPMCKLSLSKNEEKQKKSVYLESLNKIKKKLKKKRFRSKSGKLGYFKLLNRILTIMRYQNSKMIIDKYSPDLLINISRNSCDTFELYKAEELVEIGRFVASNAIGEYKKGL